MRKKWRLYQNWYFASEDLSDKIAEYGPQKRPELWEEVTLPHTFRLEPYAHRGITTAQGIGTYIKVFPLKESLHTKNLYITFEAAMGVTDVWLNGVLLHTKLADKTSSEETGEHTNYGGYLPFVVCLNDAAYFNGKDNVLVVRTNNHDDGQVPPGKPQENLDFTYFGGIYRDVWLEATESVYITDPLLEDEERGGGILLEYPVVSKERAVVSAQTQIRSGLEEEQTVILRHEILGKNDICVAAWEKEFVIKSGEAKTLTSELEVKNPELWSLESPNLYYDRATVWKDGELLDEKKTRFGIRKIEVDRSQGLLINGEVQPFLSGINRHQDYPVVGNAAPGSMQKRDAVLYKEAGFKVIRAAHYPMSEEFLNACDELGLLLFEATPGWQWYPTGDPEPFSSRVRDNIRQMVRRDRNHPCVLAYETVLNETYHVPFGFSRESAKTALAEQQSAKIAAESYGYNAAPEANGIDREADFVYGFQDPLEKTEKAVMFLREYTDCYIEYYGQFESRRVTRGVTDGFYPSGEARNLVKANQMLWRNLDDEYSLAKCYELRSENPAFVGAAIWTGIDSRGAGSLMSPCGVWDGYRLPKTSCYAFASQQEEKPILYLASEWSEKASVMDKADEICTIGSDSLREIYVYSNAATVTLSVELAGNILWEKSAVPYTDEKAGYLPHPPFSFAEVPYSKGTTLCAKGYDKDGNLIAQEERKTAGTPHHLHLYADLLGIPMQADGNDLVFLRAEVLDEQGTICTDVESRVYFQTEGDAEIVGTGNLFVEANPAPVEAGIASVYLRAGKTPGTIKVHAEAKGLKGDVIEVTLDPSKYSDIESGRFEAVNECCKKTANLSAHPMSGEAERVAEYQENGEMNLESIRLQGTACWKLHGETYLQLKTRIAEGDKDAELFFYMDDVLRLRTKAAQSKKMVLYTEGASEMRIELRACVPSEVILLSPYFWNGEVADEKPAIFANIAEGKPATASVRSEWAENVWREDDMWLGGPPRDGLQEWQVDLGETVDVRNAMVQVGGQMGSDCTFYQYEIHTSADGENWEKQAENKRTSWSNGVLDYFTARNVRYVKVVFLSVDGKLSAGIQKFEIYRDYGVDSVKEYALAGIVAENNDLVFSPECLEYTLPEQEKLTIRALAFDPKACVSICGTPTERMEGQKIMSAEPVTVTRESCNGEAVIEVQAASGRGIRRYKLHF